MIIGCLGAIVQGGVQPVFAIIFSSIIGVFVDPDLDYQKDRIFFYSMMFIVIGGGSGISMFFQVIYNVFITTSVIPINELRPNP